jgi:hypothetical protein
MPERVQPWLLEVYNLPIQKSAEEFYATAAATVQ